MRKIILNLILTIMMLTSVAFASENMLNAVVVEGAEKGNNIILRSDKPTHVEKEIQPDGTLLITLKNISSSINLDTKYVNANQISNLLIENTSNNEIKLFIQGEGAQNINIIFDTPASAPIIVSDGISKKQIGFVAAAFLLVCMLAGSFRHSVEKDAKITMKNDMTEREIKLYKELKSDILESAKIDNIIKQRMINQSLNKLNKFNKAETIRSLQKMALK